MTTPDQEVQTEGGAQMELTLRGVFNDQAYERTRLLLRAICPERGSNVAFREWERVYKRPDDPMSLLRFRQNLAKDVEESISSSKKPRYLLRHIGKPDTRTQKPCQKCPALEIRVGSNPAPLITALGFVEQFQYVRNGHRFVTSEGYTVDMYHLEKVTGNNPQEAIRLQGGILEITAVPTAERPTTPEDLLVFVTYLSPAVVIPTG